MAALDAGARAAVAAQPTPREQLRAWVVWHVLYHARHPERAKVADEQLRALDDEHRAAVVAARDAYEALVKGLLDAGREAHGWSVPHRSVVTNAITTMCTAVDGWFRAEGPLTAEQVADVYADFVLGGPRARSGAGVSATERAEVAIVGGGAAGCALAYHLTRLGCRDVLLLEQHELTSGSTWHAAGLCAQWSGSWSLMRTLRASVEGFAELEADTGLPVDFHQTGSVRLALTRERLDEFAHHAGVAETAGVPVELIDADLALELFPLLNPEGVLGAAYLPTDGHVDPTAMTNAFAAGARTRGARIERHRPVTALTRRGDGWELETPGGTVHARRVVLAAGQWTRDLGRLAGVELPVVPLQHHYVVTDAVPEVAALDRELPVLRDPEASFYVRQEAGGLLVGPFERRPLTWALDGIPPGFHGKLLPSDLDQIEDVLVAAAERVPAFASAGLKTTLNGPDGYTPDGRCLMGPVPGAPGLHVLAGFSIFGIVYSGGAGRLAAEWLLEGQPSYDAWELDVRRFGGYASSTGYVARRACEVYEHEYAIHFPHEERPAGRPLAPRRCTTGCWPEARCTASARAGSGPCGSPTPPGRATRRASGAPAGTRPSAASASASATAWGCSTSRASPSTSSPGPAPRASWRACWPTARRRTSTASRWPRS